MYDELMFVKFISTEVNICYVFYKYNYKQQVKVVVYIT